MTKNLMVLILLVTGIFPLYGADREGNGGGGIHKNGRYMTFYSAGFYTNAIQESRDNVPSLKEVISTVNSIPSLSARSKAKYIATLIPTKKRKYFKVKPDFFSEEIKKRLIKEYSKVINAPIDDLALFAVTDISTKTTFLLPSFYNLSKTEQMAILFHESYWIVNGTKATYERVIEVEMTMQAYFEDSKNENTLLKLNNVIGHDMTYAKYALKRDLENGSLDGLISNSLFSDKKIMLKNLFGEKYFNCLQDISHHRCMDLWDYRIYSLKELYPNSLFIKLLSTNTFDLEKLEKKTGLHDIQYLRKIKFSKMLNIAYINLSIKENSCLNVNWKQQYYSDSSMTGYRGIKIEYSIFCSDYHK